MYSQATLTNNSPVGDVSLANREVVPTLDSIPSVVAHNVTIECVGMSTDVMRFRENGA